MAADLAEIPRVHLTGEFAVDDTVGRTDDDRDLHTSLRHEFGMQVVAAAGSADLEPDGGRRVLHRCGSRDHALVRRRQQLVHVPGGEEHVAAVESVRRLARFLVTSRVEDLDPLSIECAGVLPRDDGGEGEHTASWLDAVDGCVRISVPHTAGVTEGVDQQEGQPFVLMKRQKAMMTGQLRPRPADGHNSRGAVGGRDWSAVEEG